MKVKYWGEYAKYTCLNVLGMIGLSCYILADTYFVAKGLGSKGLAALNLAIPVYSFIHGSGLMLGMGGATRYSMAKGQGQRNLMDEAFTCTLLLLGCFAGIFFLTGIFGGGKITGLLGADREVFAMCRTYLRVLLLFAPAFMLNDVLLCFVRNDGAPRLSMTAMLAGSISNIILDYVFIFGLRMGIFGAVLATGFAPVISMAVLSVFLIKGRNQFCPVRCKVKVSAAKHIFAGGVPSLVAELSSGIVMMIFNGIILSLEGNTGVAAYGVIANLSLVVIAVFTGIAQGIQPIVSRYYGMKNQEALRAVFWYAVITAAVLSGLVYAGISLGADDVAAVFNREGNQRLREIAVRGMRIYFTGCLPAGFNIVLSVYLTSVDKAKPAGVISLLRGIIVILPVTFLLPAVLGMTGLWLSFPVTEMLVGITGISLCRKLKVLDTVGR